MEEKLHFLNEIKKTGKQKYSSAWTERRIQQCIFNQHNKNAKFLLRNKFLFRPGHKQWESDMIMISKSGLSTELEIKVTSSDWNKEFKDKVLKHRFLNNVFDTNGEFLLNPRYNPDRKNSKQFRFTCPNYFYMTCQEGLIDPEEVEEKMPFAGLKWVNDKGRLKTKLRRKIHPYKIPYEEELLYKCYYGINDLEKRLWEQKVNFEKLSDKDLENPKFIRTFVNSIFKKLKV